MPVLQSLHRIVAAVSLDTDEYRDVVSVLTEMIEIKCGSVRPICNLVSFAFISFQISDTLLYYPMAPDKREYHVRAFVSAVFRSVSQ